MRNSMIVIGDFEEVVYVKVATTAFTWKKWEKPLKESGGLPDKIQAMYLTNMKQSANQYDAQKSTAKHPSLEDEVL
jgi:hypothetical protein